MESKVLKWILNKVHDPSPGIMLKKWFLATLWVLLTLVLVVVLQLFSQGIISDIWFMLLSIGIGMTIGVVTILRTSEKQWPLIVPHLSRESIEKRINEIST